VPAVTFRFTDKLFLEARQRSNRYLVNMRALWALLIVMLVGLVGITLWDLYDGAPLMYPWSLVFLGGYLAWLLWFWHWPTWYALRSFRQSPFCNELVRIEFDDRGFHGRGEIGNVDLAWVVFIKVVHFRDGFLLFQGSNVVNWIPVRYLEGPDTVVELEALLREKIENHKIIERVENDGLEDAG
jgi:hypothetical protein